MLMLNSHYKINVQFNIEYTDRLSCYCLYENLVYLLQPIPHLGPVQNIMLVYLACLMERNDARIEIESILASFEHYVKHVSHASIIF